MVILAGDSHGPCKRPARAAANETPEESKVVFGDVTMTTNSRLGLGGQILSIQSGEVLAQNHMETDHKDCFGKV